MHKKIMVPLGPEIRDLKSVHYALAAAERLQASVILILFTDAHEARPPWLEEALNDLVASARLAGLQLSTVEADGIPERTVVDLADQERIDLLVFSEDQGDLERGVLELSPKLGHAIIQVSDKDAMGLGTGKGEPRWQS